VSLCYNNSKKEGKPQRKNNNKNKLSFASCPSEKSREATGEATVKIKLIKLKELPNQ
jgi:hypothetical protein